MPYEIERKFLVTSDKYKIDSLSKPYKQGYLCTESSRTVRVRLAGNRGFITIKGESIDCARLEFEYEIPPADAAQLLDTLCLKPLIEKIRYRKAGPDGKIWEIDEFSGENEGLVIAEIELSHREEPFARPDWIGQEVTGDVRYYNSYLSQKPYKSWE